MVVLCGLILLQSARSFKRKEKKAQSKEEKKAQIENSDKSIIEICEEDIRNTMKKIIDIYHQTLIGLFNEDRKLLKKMVAESEQLYEESHKRKYDMLPTLKRLEDNYIDTGHYYVQTVDYIDEASKALLHICRPSFQHIDNNHKSFNEKQVDDLMHILDEVEAIYKRIIYMLEDNNYDDLDTILVMRDELFDTIAEVIINQIRRTKRGESSTKSGMLYLAIVNETKTMVLQSRNLLKAQKYFVTSADDKK